MLQYLNKTAKRIYQIIIEIPVIGYLAKMVFSISILPNFLNNFRELKTLQELSPAIMNLLHSSSSSLRKLRRDLDELQSLNSKTEKEKLNEIHHFLNHLSYRINDLENKLDIIIKKSPVDEIQ